MKTRVQFPSAHQRRAARSGLSNRSRQSRARSAKTASASPLEVTAVLFGRSWIFIGPFGSALFLSRTPYAARAVRTQVFTIGAGLKVTASALGAALIGFAAGLPVAAQLLLVASSPLFAGILGTVLLTIGARPDTAAQGTRGEVASENPA